MGAIFSGFTKSVRKRCRKRKEEKSWRISVLQQHNRALPKIQAFATPPPHNSSFWLLFLALGWWYLLCGIFGSLFWFVDFFCMCNLRLPKGVIFYFLFPSHKAKSPWEEVEEEEEEEVED